MDIQTQNQENNFSRKGYYTFDILAFIILLPVNLTYLAMVFCGLTLAGSRDILFIVVMSLSSIAVVIYCLNSIWFLTDIIWRNLYKWQLITITSIYSVLFFSQISFLVLALFFEW